MRRHLGDRVCDHRRESRIAGDPGQGRLRVIEWAGLAQDQTGGFSNVHLEPLRPASSKLTRS